MKLIKYIILTCFAAVALTGCSPGNTQTHVDETHKMYDLPAEALNEASSVSLKQYGRTYDLKKYIVDYNSRDCVVNSSILPDIFGYYPIELATSSELDPDYHLFAFENQNGDRIMFCNGDESILINGNSYDSGIKITQNEDGTQNLKLLPIIQGITSDTVYISNVDNKIEYTVSKTAT